MAMGSRKFNKKFRCFLNIGLVNCFGNIFLFHETKSQNNFKKQDYSKENKT